MVQARRSSWSDASLTHPFLNANPAYLSPDGTDPDTAVLDAARDAYLREWTGAHLWHLRRLLP